MRILSTWVAARRKLSRMDLLERASAGELVNQIVCVVEAEGPIHQEVMLERLKELKGVDRGGSTSLDTISRWYRGDSYSALNAIQRKLEAATARLAGAILHMVVLLARKCTQTGAGSPAARQGPPSAKSPRCRVDSAN